MTLLIVIFSLVNGFMYAIEPSNQDYCHKEAQVIVQKFRDNDPSATFFGGCVMGGILLNIKMTDA